MKTPNTTSTLSINDQELNLDELEGVSGGMRWSGSKLELCYSVSKTIMDHVTCFNWAAGITV